MRLTFLCHAATRSMREGGFASADEPLDDGGERKVARLDLRDAQVVLHSPAHAARQTAQLAGLASVEDAALADIDHGDWAGRSFASVHATDPDGLARWIASPATGTPGGEVFADLVARMTPWMAGVAQAGKTALAITHPMVIRAALAVAVGISAEAALRIDCGPLTQVELSYNRLWRLQALRPF